jgi:predicted membrane protein
MGAGGRMSVPQQAFPFLESSLKASPTNFSILSNIFFNTNLSRFFILFFTFFKYYFIIIFIIIFLNHQEIKKKNKKYIAANKERIETNDFKKKIHKL